MLCAECCYYLHFIHHSELLKGSLPTMNFETNPVTFSVIGVCCAIYVLETVGFSSLPGLMAFSYIGVQNGEYWRLFSSLFVHGDFMHLVFNMVALLIFGNYAEQKLMNSKKALAILLVSGISANLLAWMYAGAAGLYGYVAVGASGAIMGLLGADGVAMLKIWRYSQHPIARTFLSQVAVILALQFTIDLIVTQSSLLHHFSGALVGAALGYFLYQPRRRFSRY